jgi:hypothetical protein
MKLPEKFLEITAFSTLQAALYRRVYRIVWLTFLRIGHRAYTQCNGEGAGSPLVPLFIMPFSRLFFKKP